MIPLVDLKNQTRQLEGEVQRAIGDVLADCHYVKGVWIEKFEESFAQYCGVEYACAVSSGTAALHLALLAAQIQPGDEVVTTPYTFIATAEAISYVGAKPVFADILPGPFTIDPEKIRTVITKNTKAIIPVDLYGQPADIDALQEVADMFNLTMLEDACQAPGAEYKGSRVGGRSHLTCFSFYPSKNLGALGDAGAVVTNDPRAVEQIRMRRDHGQKEEHIHEIEGLNARMDSIQAAVLLVKLRYLDQWNEMRRKHAQQYDELLGNIEEVTTPEVMRYANPVYSLYTIRVRDRDRLREYLHQREIMTGVYYPVPLHLQPAYRYLGYKEHDFPLAEACAKEVLSLPMYPELTQDQIAHIAESTREFYQGKR
ncbi:MAG: DegT/DnrJ/EryC1/StrS family aminotransferase [Candidatus Methylomirabilales bacterium]